MRYLHSACSDIASTAYAVCRYPTSNTPRVSIVSAHSAILLSNHSSIFSRPPQNPLRYIWPLLKRNFIPSASKASCVSSSSSPPHRCASSSLDLENTHNRGILISMQGEALCCVWRVPTWPRLPHTMVATPPDTPCASPLPVLGELVHKEPWR